MRLFFFAGERSGDLHGSHLLASLKKTLPCIEAEGVGGPAMRTQPFHTILPMESFEVMGLSDVLLALPRLFKHFNRLLNHIVHQKPEAVILIDYPGFNLRLAKALRKKNYKGKIVQYVSPTVWAHGTHRIDQMAKTLDLLLTIYPFESSYFQNTSLKVVYAGNPLKEYIRQYSYQDDWREQAGIPQSMPLVALFPGSRAKEVQRNLSFQLEAACKLKKLYPEIGFALSCVDPKIKKWMGNIPQEISRDLFLVPSTYNYELMRDSRSAIAKSGTVTLELALHHRPTAVIYHVTALNRLYARHVLRLNLPHYCIVNILAGKEVFPELIEAGVTTEALSRVMGDLHREGSLRDECLQGCRHVDQKLEATQSSVKAAQAIEMLLCG